MEHREEFTKNNLELQLNAVDKQIGEILTHAEKKCTNISRYSIHQWSPKFAATIRKERDIKKKIAKLRRCDLLSNLKEVNKKLKSAMKELRLIRNELRYIKEHDKEIREAHLDELIKENVANNPGSTYAGELKRLKNIESQRASAARIKRRNNGKKSLARTSSKT